MSLSQQCDTVDLDAVLSPSWHFIATDSKLALRLCNRQIRTTVDDLVTVLDLPLNGASSSGAVIRAAGSRWPNINALKIMASDTRASEEASSALDERIWTRLMQLTVKLVSIVVVPQTLIP